MHATERVFKMRYSILVMSSVTYALKAQGVLAREGIGTRLEKLGREQSLRGCGYGLRIDKSNIDRAEKILNGERIKVIEIIDYK